MHPAGLRFARPRSSTSRRRTGGRTEIALTGAVAVAVAVLSASCAPVASTTEAVDVRDGSPTATPPADGDPAPSGAYTPFVYEPRFPGALTPIEDQECRDDIVAAGHDPSAEWVVVLSRRRTAGDLTIVRRDDRRVRVECRIRDELLPREVSAPIATDDAGILQQCGTVAGHDFTGWSVVTSMAAASGVEAVLASTNGYTAYCSLQPRGWDSGSDQEVTLPQASDRQIGRRQSGKGYRFPGEAGFNGSSLSIKTARTPIEGQLWHGSGTLYDGRGEVAEDASRVILTFADGTERFVVRVVKGRWAARIHLADATGPLGHYVAVVEDSAGEVLYEYASAP